MKATPIFIRLEFAFADDPLTRDRMGKVFALLLREPAKEEKSQ